VEWFLLPQHHQARITEVYHHAGFFTFFFFWRYWGLNSGPLHLPGRCSTLQPWSHTFSCFSFSYFSDSVWSFVQASLGPRAFYLCLLHRWDDRHAPPHPVYFAKREGLTNFCPGWPPTLILSLSTFQVAGTKLQSLTSFDFVSYSTGFEFRALCLSDKHSTT
jgi:hypothetical protein